MRANIKINIKRGIAVGLIAIMAAVNPLQTLKPIVEVAPSVAKAAETDKAPYVGEVRLAVDKDEDRAKQILTDAGYEVYDQNLNEGAGSVWNKQGTQAVYMGYKRTADEKKAIRDMKTMNMLGRYSSSDLQNWINENRSTAKEKVQPILKALKEYRINVKNGDPIALQAQTTMNSIKEDDSGELMGDLLLSEDSDEDLLVKIIVEGNVELVTNIFEGLSSACDETDSTWLERLDNFTYKKLLASYAKDLYGTEVVIGKEKEHVEKLLEAEYDKSARELLNKWDILRNAIVVPLDEVSKEEIIENFSEFIMYGEEAFFRFRQCVLVNELAKIPYNGKSILELFKLRKSVFEKDITKLYPVVAAMSDGQRAMLEYCDPADMAVQSLERMKAKEDLESGEKNETDEILKTPISIYDGVDRDMFREGAAMTSRAIAAQKSADALLSDDSTYRTIQLLSPYILLLSSVGSLLGYFFYINDKEDIGFKEAAIKDVKDKLNNPELANVRDKYSAELSRLQEQHKDLVRSARANKIGAIACLALAIITALVYVGMYIYEQYERHNRKQLPIPAIMVDKDVESDAGKLVTYRAVLWNKDRNDDSGRENRADINGDAGEQWIALYTTTDKTMGDPILADSFYTEVGTFCTSSKAYNDRLTALMCFGSNSPENLLNYTYGGSTLWMWYKKAKVEDSTVIDDVVDTEVSVDDGAEESDDTMQSAEADDEDEDAPATGSYIGGTNIVFFTVGGGVVGLIIGIFIGIFIRRKKGGTA